MNSDPETADKLRFIITAWEQGDSCKDLLPLLRMALRRVEDLEALLNLNPNHLPWE